ncbi:MAG TPA: tRNA (adenosine(37)-N6)-threonylcarbamoyltransferase complex ATPase subunit type 1 TsaE [Candidatus Acidoferrales bacterium]|nr:tRNA (adenosine(37)-N6)-threonylcarbamoyltransferase complex ATPase subunit type 1 TsaE [Candidatus Acidoferrales bacterium]
MPDPQPAREVITRSPEETIRLGRELAAELKPPLLILLSGDLGAGKTTLIKGIVAGLGAAAEDEVTSPTFTLIHKYQPALPARTGPVYHVDLYRIAGLPDLETLGLDDIFAENSIVLIEWPDRLAFDPGRPILRIRLDHLDESSRRISLSPHRSP